MKRKMFGGVMASMLDNYLGSDGSDDSDEGDEAEAAAAAAAKSKKNKFNYETLQQCGYASPDLTTFVEGYRKIEAEEKAVVDAAEAAKREEEEAYMDGVKRARKFVSVWGTWLEPAADAAREEEEQKKKAWREKVCLSQKRLLAHAHSKRPHSGITPILVPQAKTKQDSGPSTWFKEGGTPPSAPLPPIEAKGEEEEEEEESMEEAPAKPLPPAKGKKTHAQKLAATFEQKARKEAKQGQLVPFDAAKGVPLPKGQVSTYKQRLGNIKVMERAVDKQIGRAKPTFKDHRSDMLHADLKKYAYNSTNNPNISTNPKH
jgi:hypothetical protein